MSSDPEHGPSVLTERDSDGDLIATVEAPWIIPESVMDLIAAGRSANAILRPSPRILQGAKWLTVLQRAILKGSV